MSTDTADPNAPFGPEDAMAIAQGIRTELGKVIVGQADLVHWVMVALLCEGHVLLEGVPGLGKTALLRTLGNVVRLDFSRVQFTPDLMPADILGTQVLLDDEAGHRQFTFRPGPIFANLVLADELNRATPKTQSALLEAMQERSVTTAGATRMLPRPFLVMATQNPIEMEGTYPLPEAQLDRFLLKLVVPFPSAEELVQVVERTTGNDTVQLLPVADSGSLAAAIDLTRQVPVASHLVRHAVDLITATHPDHPAAPAKVRSYVRYGASPRGAQAIVLGAKALALLDGRPNVSIDDIRALAVPALRHRLVTGYEATADGVTTDAVIAEVLDAVPTPTSGVRGAP